MKKSYFVNEISDVLKIDQVNDSSVNGLQIDCSKNEIKHITFAVDFSLDALRFAKKNKSDLLFVHHGLIWKHLGPITGITYKYVAECIKADIGLFACHLPLDMHPSLGNNIELCKLLNLQSPIAFGGYHGQKIGYAGYLKKPKTINQIALTLNKKLATKCHILPFGKKEIKTIAIVSGGAADIALQAKELDIDLFISGETSHSTYNQIKDSKINTIFAGHYATEIWGVQKCAEFIEENYDIKCSFFDNPTGF